MLNNSLLKFKNSRKQMLIFGLIALGIGIILALANGGSTSSSTWVATDDTTGSVYASYDECYVDFNDCVEVKGTPTTGSASQAAIAAGLSGLGSALLSLGLVAHFLISTAESIVEGMGGNINTADPNAPKEAKKEEEPKA